VRAGEGLELGRVDEDDGDCELLEEGENRDSVVEASEADAELGEVSELETFIGGCGVGAGDVVCVSRNLLARSAVGAVWTGRARIGPAKSRSKFAGRIICNGCVRFGWFAPPALRLTFCLSTLLLSFLEALRFRDS
jgi:hypothetical protein